MNSATNEGGLRARKRVALRTTIEHTALDLVLEHGYDNVTVDMICDASTISPRTFFNYFGSKEGVILGLEPPVPSAEDVEKFTRRRGSSILADFVAMITAALVDLQPDPTLFRTRLMLIRRTPELFDRQLARMAEIEDQFVRIVLARFDAQGRSVVDQPDLDDEARMVVALGTGVMRYAMRKGLSDDFTGTSRELIDGSVELIQRIVGDDALPGADHRARRR